MTHKDITTALEYVKFMLAFVLFTAFPAGMIILIGFSATNSGLL